MNTTPLWSYWLPAVIGVAGGLVIAAFNYWIFRKQVKLNRQYEKAAFEHQLHLSSFYKEQARVLPEIHSKLLYLEGYYHRLISKDINEGDPTKEQQLENTVVSRRNFYNSFIMADIYLTEPLREYYVGISELVLKGLWEYNEWERLKLDDYALYNDKDYTKKLELHSNNAISVAYELSQQATVAREMIRAILTGSEFNYQSNQKE